jgi:hypothetical protein
MGISDEDYADALIKQKAFVAQQMREKDMADALVYERQKITSTNTGITLTTANTGTAIWENRSPLGVKTIAEKDLHHDAMKAPLSALIDMWTMRWSGEWVNEQEFQEDDFWRLALIRLVGANKLEKHSLANQYESVYRIIE